MLALRGGGPIGHGAAYQTIRPSFGVIAATLLISIVVGLLSGWLPARRAARMHPVQALRAD